MTASNPSSSCPRCGAPRVAQGRFCRQCGLDMASTQPGGTRPTGPSSPSAAPASPRGLSCWLQAGCLLPVVLVLPVAPLVEHLVLGSTRSLVPGVVLLALLAVGTSLTAAFRRTSWLWPVLFLGVTLASAILLPGYLALRAHLDPTFEGSSPTLPLGGAGGASALEMGGVALEGEMGTTPLPVLERRVPLSADQKTLVGALGMPDQFLVALDPDSGTRAEVWTWYRAQGGDALLAESWQPRAFGFLNGRLQSEAPAQDLRPAAPTGLSPLAFDPSWTEEQAVQTLGEPDLVIRKDSPVFGRITVLNYRNRLILNFRDDRLWGAQTLVTEAAP
jgi:hypothetical protein